MSNPFWLVEHPRTQECWIVQARLPQHAVWHVENRFPAINVPLTVKPYVFDIVAGEGKIIKANRDETIWYIRCKDRQSGEAAFRKRFPVMKVTFVEVRVDAEGFLE